MEGSHTDEAWSWMRECYKINHSRKDLYSIFLLQFIIYPNLLFSGTDRYWERQKEAGKESTPCSEKEGQLIKKS